MGHKPESLKRHLGRLRRGGGRVTHAQAYRWISQALRALAELHESGREQGDVSLSSLMLDADGCLSLEGPSREAADRSRVGVDDLAGLAASMHMVLGGRAGEPPGMCIGGLLGGLLDRLASQDDASRLSAREALTWLPVDPPSPVTLQAVTIEPGTFLMGAPADAEHAADHERPQRRVTLTRPFALWNAPVTQRRYAELMGANPSLFSGWDDNPVDQVTWYDAVRFCNALSRAEGLSPAYVIVERGGEALPVVRWKGLDNPGWRLPTEAEWEYACRAGGTGPSEPSLEQLYWFHPNADGRSHAVALKQPNAWGLYDMLGNVLDWCWDRWEPYREEPGGHCIDPTGARRGVARILRGGCWDSDRELLSPWSRDREHPGRVSYFASLRPARTIVR